MSSQRVKAYLVHYGLGICYIHLNAVDAAILEFTTALKLKPDMVEAHNNIAAGYLGLQKWDEAIAAAMDALRIRPDYALAKNNLAFAVNQKRKQLEAASKKK